MKLKSVLRLAACLAASHWAGAAAAQATGTAPQCCGLLPIYDFVAEIDGGTGGELRQFLHLFYRL